MAIFKLNNIKSFSSSKYFTGNSRYLNELQVEGEDIVDDDDFTMD